MKTNLPRFSRTQWLSALLAVGLLAGSGPLLRAQSPSGRAPAPPNSTSLCGGQPLCSETGDFAATITDFRTSKAGYYKIIDAAVHFQNKTNQPLILGYSDGSGLALDDQGNRFVINGRAAGNGVQGIGKILGNSIDAKFVLQPGGSGDTLFELVGALGTVEGVSFEMDLTFREITPLEGHQFTLAGEFPMRFRGLANGTFGTAPAAGGAPVAGGSTLAGGSSLSSTVAGSPDSTACGPAGGSITGQATTVANQNLPAGANSTVASATNAVNNLRGLFGRKKVAAAAAAPSANNAAPCVPASNASDGGAATASAPTSGAGTPVTRVTSASATAPVTATKTSTTTTTTTTTTRTAASTKAPAKTAATSTKKAVKPPAPTTTATPAQ